MHTCVTVGQLSQALMRPLKKIPCVVWCLMLGGCVVLGWRATSPTFLYSYNSPHEIYRLEFHQASILQRIVHRDFRMPFVVRLYRVSPKTLLRESEVVDLQGGGQFDWHLDPPVATNKVYVGNEVVFEGIPSECGDPPLASGCPAKP
ncbi:hypothetical protein AVHY2522_24865 [Acidovorax sp. SUPP2522]|uniref:hypothetical protein n=2 Tax=Acidovorax TaxID=12916 RepID=UPI0023497776|nr:MULTISPECIES: hypothetical protein [unclassified Acidovorax]WCM97873.1 hypothetical protein M5C96_26485 [Acidovorax sp. GBBC 1281]GKT20135.1 hypothetical protein AVHY2522_24865 [Acidovorax sp. SUPP2522]